MKSLIAYYVPDVAAERRVLLQCFKDSGCNTVVVVIDVLP